MIVSKRFAKRGKYVSDREAFNDNNLLRLSNVLNATGGPLANLNNVPLAKPVISNA